MSEAIKTFQTSESKNGPVVCFEKCLFMFVKYFIVKNVAVSISLF